MDFSKYTGSINFSNIKKFKTNDGKYCLIDYDSKHFHVELPHNIVAYDVDMSVNRPNVFVYLNDTKLSDFNDLIKKEIVNYVFNNSFSIYGTFKTVEELEQCYSNPKKIKKNKNSFSNILKLKLANKNGLEQITRNSRVKMIVDISGVWFSDQSFGPYYDIIQLDVIPLEPSKCLFIDTDS